MRTILLSLALIAVLCGCETAQRQESVLTRVRRNHVLRCGYVEWPKLLERDPNTSAFSGIFPEVMAQVATASGLEVQWAESLSFGDIGEALSSQRIDAVCSGVWAVTPRALAMTFSRPITYSSVYAWTRAEDAGLSGLDSLDNPNRRIATIDGEYSALTKARLFPKALELSMPKSTEGPELYLALTSKKADATVGDVTSANRFLAAHPGSIRRLSGSGPVGLMGTVLVVKKGEWALKEVLDTAIEELLNSGFVDKTLQKYEQYPNEFVRVAPLWVEK